ncbi:MAG: TolB family protein [Acidimicrobiales bacterium]
MRRLRWGAPLLVSGAVILAVACNGSDDDAGPPDTTTTTFATEQDLTGTPDPGTIVFHGYADDVERSLFTVSTTGDAATPVPPPPGVEGVSAAALAPDGSTIAALSWDEGSDERRDTLLVGTLAEGLTPLVTVEDRELWCVRWTPESDQLYLTAFRDDVEGAELLVVDAASGDLERVDLAVGRFDCAIPLGGDQVALTVIEPTPRLVVVDLDSGSERDLLVEPGCIVFGGVVSPDGSELLTALSCDTVEDSGVVAVDLDSGDAEVLFGGDGSHPAYSPSGDWIVFSVSPLDRATGDTTVWVQRRDGTGRRQVSSTPGIHAVWLAEG